MAFQLNCLVRNPTGTWFVAKNASAAPQSPTYMYSRDRLSIWSKTVEFGKRFFSGSVGAAAVFSLPVAYQSYQYSMFPTQYLFMRLGLATAGLGLACAVVTSNSLDALTRGIQFGAIAQVTSSLSEIGSRKVLISIIKVANVVNTRLLSVPQKLSNGFEVVGNRFLSAWQAFRASSNSTNIQTNFTNSSVKTQF
jgi:hypothetical protein